MSDSSPQLDSLFHAALEIASPEKRMAFLDKSCAEDHQLRAEVEILLKSQERAGSFLENPAPEFEATIDPQLGGDERAQSLQAGLAAAFTDEQAVVLGDGHHSVLKLLGQTMNNVPRVVLRDTVEQGTDPITRPTSSEMPQKNSDSRYRLDGEIARGGMGAIIRGRDTDLGRDLAIKVLLDVHKHKPEVIQRFVEEAQIGGQLQHPGIAPIYELGQFSDQRPFFAMKLVKGKTLSNLLAERNDTADDRSKFIGIFEQVCQTMAYAHSRGVIHRDLKPANIMVGAFGEVQVMDWGLAKVLPAGGVADEKTARDTQMGKSIIQTLRSGGSGGSAGSDVPGSLGSVGSQTQMGSVMGTPAYMPPEQALGEIDNLDERADVFGLGAILCEILSGKPPYVGEDSTQIFRMASRGKLDDCFGRMDASDADLNLIEIAKLCLELEPAGRPRHAGELTQRVSGHLESVETKLRVAENERAAQAVRTIEERKRHRVTMALAASIVFSLIMAGGGWMWVQSKTAQAQKETEGRINNLIGEANDLIFQPRTSLATEQKPSELDNGKPQLPDLATLERWRTDIERAKEKAAEAKELAIAEHIDAAFDENSQLAKLKRLISSTDVRVKKASLAVSFQNELTKIRLDTGSASLDESRDFFPLSSSARDYEQAFSDGGLNLVEMGVGVVVEKIQSSGIAEDIIIALDNWARVLPANEPITPGTTVTREFLMSVADRVDRNPTRKKIRANVKTGNPDELVEIANELVKNEGARQPSATMICGLAAALRESREFESAVSLLENGLLNEPGDFWLNYELGQCFFDSSNSLLDFDKAALFAGRAMAISPQSPGALSFYCRPLVRAGHYEQAISLLRAAKKRFPENPAISRRLFYVLRANGELKEATEVANNAFNHDSKNPWSHGILGLCFLNQSNFDKAVSEFCKAIELDPDISGQTAAFLRLELAIVLSLRNQGNDPQEAIELSRLAIGMDKHSPIVRLKVGIIHYIQGNLEDAIVEFREATAIDMANLYLGSCLEKQGHIEEAIGAAIYGINNATIRWNREAPVMLRGELGRGLAKHGVKGAVHWCNEAIKFDPKLPLAYTYLVDVLIMQEKPDDAIEVYRKAIAANPQDSWPRTSLSNLLQKLGRPDNAIEECREAIKLFPDDSSPYATLAGIFEKQSKFDDAIEIYRNAIQLFPTESSLHVSLARVFDKQEDLDDAIDECREAIKLDESSADAHDLLAWTLLRRGELDEAEAEYRKTIELNQELIRYRRVQGHIVKILLLKDEPDEAVAECRRWLKRFPNDARAHFSLALALKQQGKKPEESASEFIRTEELLAGGNDADTLGYCAWELAIWPDLDGSYSMVGNSVDWARRSIELAPDNKRHMSTLGVALYRDGQWQEAIDKLQKSIELGEDSFTNSLFIAMSYWQLKDEVKEAEAEARKWYKMSLEWLQENVPNQELKPFYTEAAELMGEALSTHAKPDKTPSADQNPSPEKTPRER